MTTPRSSTARVGLQLVMAALLAISTQTVMAQTSTTSAGSIETMFANASTSWVAFMNLARGVSFLAGILIAGAGLIKLKDVGDGRTQLKTPIWMAVIGAALVAMPASIDTITETMSLGTNTGTALLSQSSSSIAGVGEALNGILLFVKLLGHLAFFRGLLILKDYGSDKQGAGLGRGLTHLFGGAAAINIEATTALLASTFFTGISLPGGLGSI